MHTSTNPFICLYSPNTIKIIVLIKKKYQMENRVPSTSHNQIRQIGPHIKTEEGRRMVTGHEVDRKRNKNKLVFLRKMVFHLG